VINSGGAILKKLSIVSLESRAHKLAKLVYRMLKYGQDYVDQGQEQYETAYQLRALRNLKERAKSMGFILYIAP